MQGEEVILKNKKRTTYILLDTYLSFPSFLYLVQDIVGVLSCVLPSSRQYAETGIWAKVWPAWAEHAGTITSIFRPNFAWKLGWLRRQTKVTVWNFHVKTHTFVHVFHYHHTIFMLLHSYTPSYNPSSFSQGTFYSKQIYFPFIIIYDSNSFYSRQTIT